MHQYASTVKVYRPPANSCKGQGGSVACLKDEELNNQKNVFFLPYRRECTG